MKILVLRFSPGMEKFFRPQNMGKFTPKNKGDDMIALPPFEKAVFLYSRSEMEFFIKLTPINESFTEDESGCATKWP